jgi:hypothetical protein
MMQVDAGSARAPEEAGAGGGATRVCHTSIPTRFPPELRE